MDLMEAADDLYAVLPEEFVARRSELSAEAKKAGEKDLAAQIKKLGKPSTAAWVVNMLVRHDSDQVQQILELGTALREAQSSLAGEELRQLGRQRRQLTAAVTRQARSLASELGEKISGAVAAQVEDTLHAAMVDEEAAKALRAGMLVKPLAVTGSEVADVVESVALPRAIGGPAARRASTPRAKAAEKELEPPRPELTVVEDNSRAIAEAEDVLAKAEASFAVEERGLEKAQRKVEKREAKGLQLRSELEELRRRIAELEERIEANEDELSDAEDARDDCEDSLADAGRAVEQARKALDAVQNLSASRGGSPV